MEASQILAVVAALVSVITVLVNLEISRRARQTTLDVERLKFDLAQRQELTAQMVGLSSRLESFHIVLMQLREHLTHLRLAGRGVTLDLIGTKLKEVHSAYLALVSAWSDCKPRLPKLALQAYGRKMHGGAHVPSLIHSVESLLANGVVGLNEKDWYELDDLVLSVVHETTELDRLIRSELGFVIAPTRMPP